MNYFILLLIVTLVWFGFRIQIGTVKDDPTKTNFSVEIYPLRRFFNKTNKE